MPLRMELRSRSGDILGVTGEAYDTLDAMLPELDPDEFPLLAGVDRYEDTVFNRKQLARLVPELERLLEGAPPLRMNILKRLIDLSQEGSRTSDTQLWFIAD
jgi:hypothetical protein